MWPLPLPGQPARDTYLTCISRVSSPAVKGQLASLTERVAIADQLYQRAARDQELYTLPSDAFGPAGAVSRDELVKVYKDRMAKMGAPGRGIYDELAQPGTRCPLCGHRRVGSLDHYLPKQLFPLLSVTPANLVPACNECNKAKLAAAPATADDQTLHPYFDHVDRDPWLKARLERDPQLAVVFYADPPSYWPPLLAARVRHHFDAFKLADLYGSEAATELGDIRYAVELVSGAGGAEAVKAHLEVVAESCSQGSGRVNYWRPVTYRALADSPWYCCGGFTFS
jgi:hypothetical protein